MTVKQKEAKLITLLHVAKTQLMMSDDEYRKLIASCLKKNTESKKVSSKDLNLEELKLALRKMKAQGFVVTIKSNSKNIKESIYADDGQSRMIRGLWLELYEQGLIKDVSESALARFTKKITGTDHYAFLNTENASLLIECLKKWLNRKVLP